MDVVAFKHSINEAINFLKQIRLLKGRGVKEIGDHSAEFKKVSRKNKHIEIYQIAIKNFDYEILLEDNSIFQFSKQDDSLRYAFIQNPIIVPNKFDYINEIYSQDELQDFTVEDINLLVESINEEEYEQYLNEQYLNLEAHILRFDLDARGYKPLNHAYSHIHVGLNKNIRIPCSKILSPLMFVFFCIKNSYEGYWEKILKDVSAFEIILEKSKKGCLDLDKKMWINEERLELYLI